MSEAISCINTLSEVIGGDLRLIKVRKQAKSAFESGWNQHNNYSANDNEILKWVKSGNNYGFFTSLESKICMLDADNPEMIKDLIKVIGDTFTIRSGRDQGGYHIIFRCDFPDDVKDKIVFMDSCGDIRRGKKFYLVGPGSIHPSGTPYTIVNDAPIKTVNYSDIQPLIMKYVKTEEIEDELEQEPVKPKEPDYNSYPVITDRAGLLIEEVGYPAGKISTNGDEVQGEHPIHGSSTGTNYNINTRKQTWHCWKHNSGGDAALFLAVKHGIIFCEQAGTGTLDNATLIKRVEDIIKTDPEYRKNAEILEETQKREREEWNRKKEKKQEDTIKPVEVKEPKKLKNDIKTLKLENRLPESHFISRYVNHWTSRNDAYPEYHYCAALALLSILADRKPRIDISNMMNPIYPNIWILELGQTSHSRKSTAMQPVKRLAGASPRYRPMFHSFTPESLIEHLSDEPGEGDSWIGSHGFHLQDEAGAILEGINQKTYMSDMRDVLCSLYDCEDISRKLRTGKKNVKTEFNVSEPYITLLWSTTPERFINSCSGLDVTSGLLLRYLILYPNYPKKRMDICLGTGSQSADYDGIGNLFIGLAERIQRFDIIRMIPSDEAMKRFNTWNEELQEKYHSKPEEYRINQSILDRMAIRVFKLAMLFTIGADELPGLKAHEQETWRLKQHKTGEGQTLLSPTIPIPDVFFLEALRQVDEYFIPHAVDALKSVEDATEKDLQSRILNALKSAPDCCMNHSALLRKSRQTSKVFKEMIDALDESGMIEMGSRKGKGEKYETWYQLKEDEE